MIVMIRTLHPVGQGTFIREKFVERNGRETIIVRKQYRVSGQSENEINC